MAYSERRPLLVNSVWIGSALPTKLSSGVTVWISYALRDTNLASCVLELFAMRERNISVLFLQKARVSILLFFFTGTKIKLFDTTPTQFVALAPNIWSWPMWKAGIFMHHDVSILEQVS